MKRTGIAALCALFLLLSACSPAPAPEEVPLPSTPPPGQIYLYGESHAVQHILDRELELWSGYYNDQGMRHLFVEAPYYTAEFLNLWMQSDSDDILDALYQDWEGSLSHDPGVREFYVELKRQCPETMFHGTDVGHQYSTTGMRYLRYLWENGLGDSEQARLAQENIDQGKYYYGHSDDNYRENKMAENFIRAFDALDGESIMGIYGSYHTIIDGLDAAGTVPRMANQLHEVYGDTLHTEDLTGTPLRVDTITVGGKEYQALYYGEQDTTGFSKDYSSREFWRLEDAYNDFKDNPKTGNILPYDNYPMPVGEGQVFVIDYTRPDGTVDRQYQRTDGYIWQGRPSADEFTLE